MGRRVCSKSARKLLARLFHPKSRARGLRAARSTLRLMEEKPEAASWLDARAHPLHVMTFPPRYAYEELDAAFDRFREHYRGMVKDKPLEEFVLVVDISKVEQSEARNRKRIARAMDDLAELMKTRCVAQAYVV